MKIAIPTRENQVDEHFGHCEYYTIVSISVDHQIEKMEVLPSPQGCGCKSNIVSVFQEIGVKIMLAGNMGQGAVNKITSAGIKVYRGCSGEVKQLVESFLKEEIADSGETCSHHNHGHDDGHQCNH